MSAEPHIHLLLELEEEAARWRRRTMFLLSVLLHGVLVVLLLIEPEIFKRGAKMLGLEVRPKRETTFLYLPPEAVKRPRTPTDTDILSDKNRRAQGKSPTTDPNGLRMPYSLGNTPLPEIAGGTPPLPPAPPPGGPPSSGSPASPPAAKKEDNGLRLTDIPAQSPGTESRLHLPSSTPGEAIQQSLQAAARGRVGGPSAGAGDSVSQLHNIHPNFSTEGPIILSDTRGVDFGPYLLRVIYSVRQNWYAVIPESARLGEKGRVAIVFEIIKDGSVPELRLVGSSGSEPLDRAALASIRASNPFPPLPEEFTGNHLVLQFIFLYNMGYAP